MTLHLSMKQRVEPINNRQLQFGPWGYICIEVNCGLNTKHILPEYFLVGVCRCSADVPPNDLNKGWDYLCAPLCTWMLSALLKHLQERRTGFNAQTWRYCESFLTDWLQTLFVSICDCDSERISPSQIVSDVLNR